MLKKLQSNLPEVISTIINVAQNSKDKLDRLRAQQLLIKYAEMINIKTSK